MDLLPGDWGGRGGGGDGGGDVCVVGIQSIQELRPLTVRIMDPSRNGSEL